MVLSGFCPLVLDNTPIETCSDFIARSHKNPFPGCCPARHIVKLGKQPGLLAEPGERKKMAQIEVPYLDDVG